MRPYTRALSALALPLLLSLSAELAHAQSFVSVDGTLQYEDRPFDMNGFTGFAFVPARYCRVELVSGIGQVVDADDTDALGAFSLSGLSSTGSVSVRAVAQSGTYNVAIMDGSTTANPIWAFTLASGLPVLPSQSLGVVQVPAINSPIGFGLIGHPLNILDEAIKNSDFLASLLPGVPLDQLAGGDIVWPFDSPGSFYAGVIYMAPDSAYDDTIIQHEIGHRVHYTYGDSDSPGGDHYLCDNNQDPRLSWGEGFATFWGSLVRRFDGEADPGIYVNTHGSSGSSLNFSYRLEDLSDARGDPWCGVGGNASESAVQCALWDLADVPTALPDDDPFDGSLLPGGVDPTLAFWDVLTTYLKHPGSFSHFGDIVFDDFWKGWWARGYLQGNAEISGFVETMRPWQLSHSTYVATSGGLPGENGTLTNPFDEIGEASVAAPPGGTLRIAGGTYDTAPVSKYLILETQPGTGSVIIDP